MIGHIAYAAGSPCPTLVLDARQLPGEESALLAALAEIRRWLVLGGGAHILKIALIEPSAHPLFDLDYRFFQALPDGLSRFDLRGSCGHSVLSAITAASRCGMLSRLGPGDRVRVNVLNNGNHLVCEVDEASRDTVHCTMHFLFTPPTPVTDLLLTGDPRTTLDVDGDEVTVSLISAGNPYVFVGPEDARVASAAELFGGGPALFDRLVRIRAAAATRLGWPVDGAFPKVAVAMPDGVGRVAVRAVTVPGWHPTLALTGAACVGAATCVPGTIPWQAARDAGCVNGMVDIETPGGSTAVTSATRGEEGRRELAWISVGDKRVTFHGSYSLQSLTHFELREIGECLSLPV